MASHSLDVLARLPTVVPAALAARADGWNQADRAAEPALSASVILLRDGAAGLETYLLHRHSRMPFAASMVVFPGGGLDPDDARTADSAPDAAPSDPVRVCALRETWEETTVQLADADLFPWAHWTTPVMEPRRYDTSFFVAALPAGAVARDVSGETDQAGWITPTAALEAADRGDLALMPPTRSMLLELAAVPDVAAVLALATDRVVVPVLPRLTRGATGWSFSYPVPS